MIEILMEPPSPPPMYLFFNHRNPRLEPTERYPNLLHEYKLLTERTQLIVRVRKLEALGQRTHMLALRRRVKLTRNTLLE